MHLKANEYLEVWEKPFGWMTYHETNGSPLTTYRRVRVVRRGPDRFDHRFLRRRRIVVREWRDGRRVR